MSAAPAVFDSHLHIIDPRFPLVPNQGWLPEPFTAAAYRAAPKGFRVLGGAVVSGSFQAFDQDYLLAALKELGPGFVGVTQLPATVSDQAILDLDAAGVRAVRFNLRRGGSAGVEDLDRLARRVHELAGWHTELYVDSTGLDELHPLLSTLPAVGIDHLGLSRAGFPALLRLVEGGVRVKATGFGRVDLDVAGTLKAICAANPEALLFGSDLPCTRAPRPYTEADLRLVLETLEPDQARRVLVDNALAWYRPRAAPVGYL